MTGKTLAENLESCPHLSKGQVRCIIHSLEFPELWKHPKRCLHLDLWRSCTVLLEQDGLNLSPKICANVEASDDAVQKLIYTLENPIKKTGHLQILYGNLAPEGSVAKITGKEGLYFSGT